ncbi:hypothetical protein DER46DRAFT_600486 [Fusarium sp. MPI-SDFR-AT-0072]|nr:hypothetical protein DER46DRAFT_600486 [Fusarium sp. MPI-SDFR-AT-0072]
MKSSIVLAVALPMVLAHEQTCGFTFVNGGNPWGQNARKWKITGKDIGDEVAGDAFCNGIKDNLNCTKLSWNCRSDGNRGLILEVVTSEWCSGEDLDNAWWYATNNRQGPLCCKNGSGRC